MRMQRVALALTIVNLVLLMVLLAQVSPLSAQETAPILRGRALQIVDEAGRVRASLSVLPAGEQSSETVLLRLITEQGRPSDGAAQGPYFREWPGEGVDPQRLL